jgi:ADP-ribose pyrophosphatase YjhB (NUDIX family)
MTHEVFIAFVTYSSFIIPLDFLLIPHPSSLILHSLLMSNSWQTMTLIEAQTLAHQRIQVSLAILYGQDKFLLQLRDDIPGIMSPGCWGLFGGHLEAEETPESAVIREIQEEIAYNVSEPIFYNCYSDERVIRYIFAAPLTVEIADLQLNEGWDFKLVTPLEIESGFCYSERAKMDKPLGKIHRQILLDFIATKLN